MQTNQTFSVLFWVNRHKSRKGEAPIYARITVNGKRVEVSLKRWVSPNEWNPITGKVKGSLEKARTINSFLDMVKGDFQKIYNGMYSNGENITAETLKNQFLGTTEKQKTLLEVFKFHNDQMQAKIGIEFAKGTYQRYEVAYRKLEKFIKHQYKKSDFALEELSYKFMADFDFYLKTVDKIDHNTVMKYIKSLKKVTRMALLNGWLEKNPFDNFKCSVKETERGFLSEDELHLLSEKQFVIKRLEEVRDIFLFSCYTGYAYVDVVKLTPQHLALNINEQSWIITNREKTHNTSNVPLLNDAVKIIEKYQDHPEAQNKGKLFPVKSNQKMNAYLKEIADICGIEKNLTCHLARHTFATTVTLSNGVPIETVSAMLGHKSLKTTKIYAKVLDVKVANDMRALQDKLSKKDEKGKLKIAK